MVLAGLVGVCWRMTAAPTPAVAQHQASNHVAVGATWHSCTSALRRKPDRCGKQCFRRRHHPHAERVVDVCLRAECRPDSAAAGFTATASNVGVISSRLPILETVCRVVPVPVPGHHQKCQHSLAVTCSISGGHSIASSSMHYNSETFTVRNSKHAQENRDVHA